MYLHLGGGAVVTWSSVLAICDMDNASYSYLTREFLRKAEEDGRVVSISDDLPKSFVLCDDGGEKRVYLSQLNSATLLKRTESIQFE